MLHSVLADSSAATGTALTAAPPTDHALATSTAALAATSFAAAGTAWWLLRLVHNLAPWRTCSMDREVSAVLSGRPLQCVP